MKGLRELVVTYCKMFFYPTGKKEIIMNLKKCVATLVIFIAVFLLLSADVAKCMDWENPDIVRQNKEAAQAKAKDLIRMAVSKAVFLEPIETFRSKVEQAALVIGAGISGMTSALAIADQGFNVILLEKQNNMGGLLKHLDKLSPDNISASEFIEEKITAIKNNSRIKYFTSAVLKEITGYVGNFSVTFLCANDSHIFKIGVGNFVIDVRVGLPELPHQKGFSKYHSRSAVVAD